MIKPTVGRIVWYRPYAHELFVDDRKREEVRWPAIVVYVWRHDMVNLAVFDPNGALKPHTSVVLAQGDEEPGEGECEWMPFQKEQAQRHAVPSADIPQAQVDPKDI